MSETDQPTAWSSTELSRPSDKALRYPEVQVFRRLLIILDWTSQWRSSTVSSKATTSVVSHWISDSAARVNNYLRLCCIATRHKTTAQIVSHWINDSATRIIARQCLDYIIMRQPLSRRTTAWVFNFNLVIQRKQILITRVLYVFKLKMPQYCCVPGCTNKKGGHLLPKEPRMKQKWRVAIRRTDPVTKNLWKPGEHDRVCSDHFAPADFKTTLTG